MTQLCSDARLIPAASYIHTQTKKCVFLCASGFVFLNRTKNELHRWNTDQSLLPRPSSRTNRASNKMIPRVVSTFFPLRVFHFLRFECLNCCQHRFSACLWWAIYARLRSRSHLRILRMPFWSIIKQIRTRVSKRANQEKVLEVPTGKWIEAK